jgi:hypothetical protein
MSSRLPLAASVPQAQAAPLQQRTAVLVVGMHRSGTSAATRIISLLGAELPDNLMPAHAEFNAAGFWESLEIVALNDRLLHAAQSAWDDVLPVDAAAVQPAAMQGFLAGARELLARDFAGSDWFVLKDPRIGRLLQPWLEVVRGVGARPLVVIPIRHPAEVAASLARREGFSEAKSLYLWLRHMLDVLRASRGVPRAVLAYDALMSDWQGSVQRLAQQLGVHWPREPGEVAEEAGKFLRTELRHHVGVEHPMPEGLPQRRALELYEALRGDLGAADALADRIHEELRPIEAAFTPLQRDAVRQLSLARAKAAAELADMRVQRDQGVTRMVELEDTLAAERHATINNWPTLSPRKCATWSCSTPGSPTSSNSSMPREAELRQAGKP